MQVTALKTPLFTAGQDLLAFITGQLPKMEEGSVLVIASKIVALSENRITPQKSQADYQELIKKESQFALKTKFVWLTVKNGLPMPNAGIDESNADNKLILLPIDCHKSASRLRQGLRQKYHLKTLGVIISDSCLMPLRAGVTGLALGYAGFAGLRDYRGKEDLYGRKMVFSSTNVADSLATAATLLMGEGNEQQPLALIKNAPIIFCEEIDTEELKIAPEDDMYGSFFQPNIAKKLLN